MLMYQRAADVADGHTNTHTQVDHWVRADLDSLHLPAVELDSKADLVRSVGCCSSAELGCPSWFMSAGWPLYLLLLTNPRNLFICLV